MRIGVIGAGHAGVEAAGQARRHGAEVVLFSGEPVPPYFRPRVVALAFGQVEPDGIHLKPEPWYREQGIELRLNAEVTGLDAPAKCVTAGGREEKFDALVVATGAAPALLPFLREFPHDIIPLWGVRESLAIRERFPGTRRVRTTGPGSRFSSIRDATRPPNAPGQTRNRSPARSGMSWQAQRSNFLRQR
jgi:3-phenylpropionate/trans-cinnamate dioxygenase ferredoxin reductase subunit